MDLSPRAVIAGRYRVDTKVGAGGMGEVWVGEHIAVGVQVAVKTLLPAAAMNNEVVARFKREAMFLGKIRSDHVARVVDFVADDVYGLVLVMEYVEGDALSRILQEKPLTIEESIDLAVDIASALKDLHQVNVIHRDLKPGNIIMKPLAHGHRRAVVVDFGVSRLMSDKSKDEDEEITGITRADMAVGTIEYMAPEQILNSRNVTPGSDIYAAGAILFRGHAGRHVFGNVTSDAELAQKKLTTESPPLPLTRTDKVAEGFARVVARMLKRRPSERFKSADEVLAELIPVRDMARLAATEADGPTIDTGKGAKEAAPVAASAAAAAAGQAGSPTSAPSAPSTSVSVTAAHPLGQIAPQRRGIPPVVTFGLVAAALAGGLFLGPRLMAPTVVPTPEATAPAAAATQAPAATAATVAPTAAAEATAAPTVAATVAPSVSASAAASTTPTGAPAPTAAAATAAPIAPAPVAPPVPGPLPRPSPPKPAATPTPVAPAPPPKPVPAQPQEP